ncbi:MAG: hypothetical protein ACK4HE_10950 [Chitinophagaceae bacterium]
MSNVLLQVQSTFSEKNTNGFFKRYAKPLFWIYLFIFISYIILTIADWINTPTKPFEIFLRCTQIVFFALLVYDNGKRAFGHVKAPATNSYLNITTNGIHFLNLGSTTPEFSPFSTIKALVVGEHSLRIKHHHQADAVFYFEGISINDREALRAWIQQHANAYITTP